MQSAYSAYCIIPPLQPGIVSISLSLANQKYILGASVDFEVYSQPAVHGITPKVIFPAIQDVLIVHGRDFLNISTLACKVGGKVMRGTYLSKTQISCDINEMNSGIYEGSVPVEVALNGEDFTEDQYSAEFLPVPIITRLRPQQGPRAGGTTVSVRGSRIDAQVVEFCSFNGSISVAHSVSSEEVKCVAPLSDSYESKVVDVQLLDIHHYPIGNSLSYTYTDPLSVSAMHPKIVTDTGGSVVTIIGTNFDPASNLTCRFGRALVVRARWVASTLIQCRSPAMSPGYVKVSVSDNGYDFAEIGEYLKIAVSISVGMLSSKRGVMGIVESSYIDVHGTGFVDVPSLRCKFGNVESSVTQFVDETKIRCSVPAAKGAGPVPVSVSLDGIIFHPSFLMFEYVLPSAVEHLEPHIGPVRGGTVVFISGSNFGANMRCKFGSSVVPATWYSPTKIRCTSPAASLASSVDILLYSQDTLMTPIAASFVYKNEAIVDTLVPTFGPEKGGTEITVVGSNFDDKDLLVCAFSGHQRSRATILNRYSALCTAPAHKPGDVEVSLSINGQQFSASKSIFTYFPRVNITTVEPSSGTLLGGDHVYISGSGMTHTETMACRFGSYIVPGIHVNNSCILCITPMQQSPREVAVAVSLNGVDFTDAPSKYTFTSDEEYIYLSPSRGPRAIGTQIAVYGLSVASHMPIACAFGEVTVPATSLGNMITCTAPPHETTGHVAVSIVEGSTPRIKVGEFEYVEIKKIYKLNPSSGPELGGIVVNVETDTLPYSTAYYCKFGTASVRARIKCAGVLTCLATPPLQPGITDIRIVDRWGQALVNSVPFEIYPTIDVTAVEPKTVFGADNVYVTLRGSNFYSSKLHWCCIGNQEVPAFGVTADAIKCPIPSVLDIGTYGIGVSTSEYACSSVIASGQISVTIAKPIMLEEISPLAGPLDGSFE